MTKSELTEALSKELNLSLMVTTGLVSTIIDSRTNALANGENIEIRGFGSFTVKHYEPYTGRNPKTGKEIEVKAKKLPFFKVGKDLKKAVNGGHKDLPVSNRPLTLPHPTSRISQLTQG